MKVGDGRVVILGDADMLSALLGEPPQKEPIGMNYPGIDNRQMTLNIMHWLSGLIDDPKTSAMGRWPSFRGPNATGLAKGSVAVTTWNATTGDNILWKTPIPRLAHSRPLIWDG